MLRAATLLLSLACCLVTAADAAELRNSQIEFHKGAYNYHFSVEIAAPLDATREVVTNYDKIKLINDSVRESRVLETYPDGTSKRLLLLKQCLLVFCFDLRFVEHVEEKTTNVIVTTVIPEESNFKRGESTWRLIALNPNRTQITVAAEQEPDFWIPPVIGPALMKRVFRKEIRETVDKIEHAAINLTVAE